MQSESSPGGRRRSFIEGARRAQIVAAAAHTVAAVGYAGASLSRIATQAGISKSVISYHFAGKEDLLAQVVNDFFTATDEYMSGRLARAETAAGAIRTW
ncbi:MAG TPA: helix-turn-helix domain-containing protein, partial [Beutenbergiaceae bacterium]|nr:helix-turn-helix domain-containing protein [Beutenbergiaceae bacterium]